jgi:hypothetical protein
MATDSLSTRSPSTSTGILPMTESLEPQTSTLLRVDARPWWMTALGVTCLATLVISVVRDLFLPESRWVEVWFGFELTGPLALLTAPLHWLIFAIGTWAFWTGQAWVVPWAAGYLFYAAFSHLVWSEVSPHGRGWPIGLAQAAAISTIGVLLLRTRRRS